MGSPISGPIAEIFLQNIENTHIKHLLDTKNIIYYTRYVDDILIIYDTRYTNDNAVHKYTTWIHANLQLNPTYENNEQINFLDLLIIRKATTLKIDIYRKLTTMNTTINYLSNHPNEHKIAAYRYYIRRMLTLPLTTERQAIEWRTIKDIAKSNNFPTHLITKLRSQMRRTHTPQKTETSKTQSKPKKWAIFTYHSPRIRKLTNLFKHTDIGIAFRNTNTTQHLTKPKPKKRPHQHDSSGIYELTCNTCKLAYIGQTSRNLNLRYKEHT
jgi:hypothetical protein